MDKFSISPSSFLVTVHRLKGTDLLTNSRDAILSLLTTHHIECEARSHRYGVLALEVNCNMIFRVFSSPLGIDLQAPLRSTDWECPWADHLADFLWPPPEVLDGPVKLGPSLANVDLHQLSLSTNIILHVFSSPLGLGVMPRDRECPWGDILTKLMACPIAQFGRGQAVFLVTLAFTKPNFKHFLVGCGWHLQRAGSFHPPCCQE